MRQRSSSRCAVRGMRTSCSGPTRPGAGVSGAARLRLRGDGRGRRRGHGRRRAWDRRRLAHDPGRGHPERPDRLRVLLDHLGDARDLVHVGARAAVDEELALVHPAAHIERVAASAGRARVVFDPDTATSAESWEAARLAAGSLLVVCEAVLAGQVQNGFALVRPPGHHAERERAMGFCLFNNVALAAARPKTHGVEPVAVFDCDHRDPLGGMEVTPAGFAAMAHASVALARECAGGRIAAVLEGGYDLAAIVEGVDATLAAMRGAERTPPPATGDARRAERVL